MVALPAITAASATEVSSATTPVAPTVEETAVGAGGMVIRVGVAGLEIAWRADPDDQRRDDRRQNRHEDATEDQHPAQRNTREDGQDSSEGRVGDEKPGQVPHELLARPLQKTTPEDTYPPRAS